MGMICRLYSVSPAEADQVLADTGVLSDLLVGRQPMQVLNLHKSWNALHFVLTGSSGEAKAPLGFLLNGGETVRDVEEEQADVPTRVLPPAFVKRLEAALARFATAEFDKRFDLAKLTKNEVYPPIWTEQRETLLEEHLMYFERLKSFIHRAAEADEAVVVSLDI